MDVNKPIPGKPLTVMCVKCGKREGTERWVGDGGVLALTHGMYEMWCLGCALRVQIARAEERAAALPELRRQLAEFEGGH